MNLIDRESAALIQTYKRQPVTFVSGSGSWLRDDQGREYLDFLTGLAVVSVGHGNPAVAEAISRQAEKLTHVSNLFYTEPQVVLAERLIGLSGLDRVFFANDGATANEAAIKLARRWGQRLRGFACHEVITLDGSFHGRTLATLAATGQPAKQATFAPLPSGFTQIPGGNIDALGEAVSDRTAAIMLETTQGEGGVIPLSEEYLSSVRALCDEREVLLIVDDVQAGIGRTGTWFSWQRLGFEPDIATSAKALANGLPIGACLARDQVAEAFDFGDHATTFGGGPVVAAAALAVLEEIESNNVLENVLERSRQLIDGLGMIDGVGGVRGRGLLLAAIVEDGTAGSRAERALEAGLIVNAVAPDALRLAPPLTVSQEEVDTALARLAGVLQAR